MFKVKVVVFVETQSGFRIENWARIEDVIAKAVPSKEFRWR